MEEFLDKLINESSYSTFERALESIGRENYIKDEYFKQRTKSERPNFIFGFSNFHTVQSMILSESLTQRTNVSRVSLIREVSVGSLKSKEQLEIDLKGKFYHTKCSNINLAEHNIKYDKINVEYNGSSYDFNSEEFNRKPRGVMQISEKSNLVFGYSNLVNSCIRVNFLIKWVYPIRNL